MNVSTILKTSLLLAVFFQSSAASRADGDKENEALRKQMQALRADIASLDLLLREMKKETETKLQQRSKELDELRKQNDELRRESLRNKEEAIDLKRLADKLEERKARVQAEIEAKSLKARNLELETQIRELSRELHRAKALGQPMKEPLVPGKGENFPANLIEGRIVEIDKESKLLKLSIGSDAGLVQGHQLRVYRLDPIPGKSKYLGVIEVVSVRPQEAIARMSKKRAAETPLQVGDRLASHLLEEKK